MHAFRRPVASAEEITNPSREVLRALAGHEGKITVYGSVNFITGVRNRSAKFTCIVEDGVRLGAGQRGISLERAGRLAEEVHNYLRDKAVIRLDRQMGNHPSFKLHCRLYITREYARIPLQCQMMLFEPENPEAEPDLVSIYVPEWPERIIFCHPEAGVTYILGTDYFGECKKSFLRMAMYKVKKQGWLGLHAGSKVLRVRDAAGRLKEVGFILFGLSGTGKTTLTMHDHGLSGEEGVAIRQDDVVMMNPRGYCYGTESGFYIKTEGLDESQAVLYRAATSPAAVFENVKVLEDGQVLFDDYELTSNGRGVILRRDVSGADDRIDIDKAHRIIFITRRDTIIPPVARLSPEQAAAYFMLGESIETSAGDPTRAGQSKRVVGTNPFIIGPEEEEGNRLLEILRSNPDMECYLLNTGRVGAGAGFAGEKITVAVSAHILREIARDSITWQADPDWGYQVSVRVPGLDLDRYHPVAYYQPEVYTDLVEQLRQERLQWLYRYPELKPEIIRAVEKPFQLAEAAVR
ncbi:MAG: phosphoenolpyruvate carboxykinase (ATP) [Thermoanaerobacteraceae bacterium]|nr:phosphoenolpyruvate carboxykinase (ATP) [Thermoanaerobacteraceae bacterium]